MTGHEVLTKIRLARVEAPTLILLGLDDTESEIRRFGLGADDCLTKNPPLIQNFNSNVF